MLMKSRAFAIAYRRGGVFGVVKWCVNVAM